jgi:hypothetical protein
MGMQCVICRAFTFVSAMNELQGQCDVHSRLLVNWSALKFEPHVCCLMMLRLKYNYKSLMLLVILCWCEAYVSIKEKID